MVGSNNVIDST